MDIRCKYNKYKIKNLVKLHISGDLINFDDLDICYHGHVPE